MLKSKKGQEALGISLATLVSMVLGIMIAMGLFTFIYAIRTGEKLEQRFLAMDIATLIDTITISPYDLAIDYPKDTHKLAINIEKEKVSVYKPPKLISTQDSYKYSEDKNIIYEYAELIPSEGLSVRPLFIKEGNKINVIERGYYIAGIQRPVCTELPNKESLKANKELINVITKPIDNLEQLGNNELIAKAKGADVAVIILLGEDIDETINKLNAYIHVDSAKSSESKYLACLIINKILDNERLNSLIQDKGLREFTSQSIQPTDKYDILNLGNIALILDIGNKRIPKERNILDSNDAMQLIEESITQGIDAYG